MNKGELVEAIATRAGLDRRQAESALNAFVSAVTDTARRGEKVAILGFGTFNPAARGARTGRNPQTGAAVKIAASKTVRFAPGTALKTALNSKGKKAAPATKAAASRKTQPASKAAAGSRAAPAKAAATKAAAAKKTAATRAATSTKKQ